MKNKPKFQPGNLIEMLQADELCIGARTGDENESFNPGDLLLVIENDAVIDDHGGIFYHFISAKSGNSIYWDREDLDSYNNYFKKVEV
jgi:hypothetical protein